MHCPSCQKGILKYSQLEENLPCQTCNHCEGNWLLLIDYLSWQSANKHTFANNDVCAIIDEQEDTRQALICPISGKLMTKYRISSTSSHKIDLSSTVNAMWLDKGEWQLLKQEGLIYQLNTIFTQPYQKHIRDELASKNFTVLYQQQFGKESYEQLKTFKEWLDKQDKRAEMLAYLITERPYSPIA